MTGADEFTIRDAVERIRAECNAGRLGNAARILREFNPDDRDRIAAALDRPLRRVTANEAEDANSPGLGSE